MKNKIIFSIIPNILFFLSIFYVIFLNLSLVKSIEIQNNISLIFIQTLSNEDIGRAIIACLEYLFYEAVLPSLPFLFFLSLGFTLLFSFKEKINFIYFFLSQIAFLLLVIYLINFSKVVVLTSVGIFISSVAILKFFEKGKSAFSTIDSLISKHLRIVVIFLCIGIFLSMYANYENYKDKIMEGNINLIKIVSPDIENLQKKQVEAFVDQCSQSMEFIVNTSYENIPNLKESCKPMYNSILFGIKSYKEETLKQAENTTFAKQRLEEYITSYFPIVEESAKAMPAIITVLIFSFFEILKLIFSVLFALFFAIFAKVKAK